MDALPFMSVRLFFFVLPFISGSANARHSSSVVTSSLQILGLPVGQGDGTIIVCPEYNGDVIVYDMGSTFQGWTPSVVKAWLGEQTLNGDQSLLSRITTVIISHPHTDHYNYLPEVIQPSRRISAFVGGHLTDYKYSGIDDWLNSVTSQEFNSGEKCLLGECTAPGWTSGLCSRNNNVKFDVLAVNYGNDANEKSVVLQVVYGEISTLLVGDFEGTAQGHLINDLNDKQAGRLKSTIYKVSHHGASRLANYLTWLQAVSADWAFISSAYPKEMYGHPRCDTIDRLLQVESLSSSEQHEIPCGDSENNVHKYNLVHRVYSTWPQPDTLCLVVFEIDGLNRTPQFRWTCDKQL